MSLFFIFYPYSLVSCQAGQVPSAKTNGVVDRGNGERRVRGELGPSVPPPLLRHPHTHRATAFPAPQLLRSPVHIKTSKIRRPSIVQIMSMLCSRTATAKMRNPKIQTGNTRPSILTPAPQILTRRQKVTWDGPSDSTKPKNWPMSKSGGQLLPCQHSVSLQPSPPPSSARLLVLAGRRRICITNKFEIVVSLSFFVLAWAVGPFFLAPVLEVYRCAHVLQISNLFFLAWNTDCGFSQNRAEIIVFRFLASSGGSAQLTAGGGVLSDCWLPSETKPWKSIIRPLFLVLPSMPY